MSHVPQVGWVHGLHSLLQALDRRVPLGSEVIILSEKSLEWRDAELAVEGLSRSGDALEDDKGDEGDKGGGVAALSHRKPVIQRQDTNSSSKAGLANLRLRHIVGFPTDETAIRRLPLERAAAAIVSADVDSADVDTQITDSEVMTSAHLLRRVYEPLAIAHFERRGSPPPPLSVVVEFNHVNSKKVIEAKPNLLTPRDGLTRAGSTTFKFIDVIAFHRNYLETAALAISAHSHASWIMMRRLLDPRGGVDLRSLPASVVLEAHELCDASAEASSESSGLEPTFHFHELASRASERGHGVLLGWNRYEDSQSAQNWHRKINPRDKLQRMRWHERDQLIVVARVGDGTVAVGEEEHLLSA